MIGLEDLFCRDSSFKIFEELKVNYPEKFLPMLCRKTPSFRSGMQRIGNQIYFKKIKNKLYNIIISKMYDMNNNVIQ